MWMRWVADRHARTRGHGLRNIRTVSSLQPSHPHISPGYAKWYELSRQANQGAQILSRWALPGARICDWCNALACWEEATALSHPRVEIDRDEWSHGSVKSVRNRVLLAFWSLTACYKFTRLLVFVFINYQCVPVGYWAPDEHPYRIYSMCRRIMYGRMHDEGQNVSGSLYSM
jgi:hypothetical protein